MENIRVVASDFDGTILKDGAQQVDEIYFPLIRALKEKGISFIAASGRQYPNLRRLLRPVADEISYICENGAPQFFCTIHTGGNQNEPGKICIK